MLIFDGSPYCGKPFADSDQDISIEKAASRWRASDQRREVPVDQLFDCRVLLAAHAISRGGIQVAGMRSFIRSLSVERSLTEQNASCAAGA